MKLKTEQHFLSPRVPVITQLRPATVSSEIWPLKAVAAMVLAVIALCVFIAVNAPRVTEHVLDRIDDITARMDDEQLCRELELNDEKGGAL